jgi:hypothetical protein
VAVGERTFPPALTQNQEHIRVLIDIGELQADQLRAAGASVEQQHHERGIAAGLEALALTDLEQPPQPIVGDHGHGPEGRGPDTEMTSVSAGHPWWGGGEGI